VLLDGSTALHMQIIRNQFFFSSGVEEISPSKIRLYSYAMVAQIWGKSPQRLNFLYGGAKYLWVLGMELP
jgi:hypothetical protein